MTWQSLDYTQRHFTIEEIEEAIRLWHRGLDTFDIARKFHVAESAIYNKLPKWRRFCGE